MLWLNFESDKTEMKIKRRKNFEIDKMKEILFDKLEWQKLFQAFSGINIYLLNSFELSTAEKHLHLTVSGQAFHVESF